MRHISYEELLDIIDDPSNMTVEQRKHLDSCRACAVELRNLKILMNEISFFPEPEIDGSLMEDMANRIEERISSDKYSDAIPIAPRHKVPKWAGAILLPIAAAALLFLLPQIQRWSSSSHSTMQWKSEEIELSQYQWQMIWDGLLDDMEEINMLTAVSHESSDPVTDLQQLSDDELERFLYLLEKTEIG